MGRMPKALRAHAFKKGTAKAKKRGASGGRKSRPAKKKK